METCPGVNVSSTLEEGARPDMLGAVLRPRKHARTSRLLESRGRASSGGQSPRAPSTLRTPRAQADALASG